MLYAIRFARFGLRLAYLLQRENVQFLNCISCLRSINGQACSHGGTEECLEDQHDYGTE